MDTRAELRALIASHRLARRDVAGLLHVSLDSVHSWLRPPGNAASREPPRMAVELLRLRCIEREREPLP